MNGAIHVENKRQFQRIRFAEPVEYRLTEGIPASGCLSYNISEGGIRLKTDQFLPLNADMILNFRLSTDEPVSVNGKVVWVQKVPHAENYHVGVQFDHSSLQDSQFRGQIQKLINPA